MATPLNRKIIAVCTVILILAILVTGLYGVDFLKTTSPFAPLTYSLVIDPANGTILQGQTFDGVLTANYLNGTSQKIMLRASFANGITCNIATASGTPTDTFSFKSMIQISASPNATSGNYDIDITSTAKNGETKNTTFVLKVLNAFINVSGTVTADFDDEIVPNGITFENIKTHEKFTTNVLTMPITGVPSRPIEGVVQTGRYWLMLPNIATYSVTCSWMRVPLPGAHFDRAANGSFYGTALTVNFDVGVDSLVGNNYDGV